MMLHVIREKAKGWFAWLIVILISVPFALWGIGSYITPEQNLPVAKVDGVNVSSYDFKNALQQELQNNNESSARSEDMSRKMVLDRLINNRALLNHLNEQGYASSQALIEKKIISDKNFIDAKTGQFSAQQFNQILARMGLTYERYIGLLKDDILVQQYVDAIKYSSFATKSEIDQLIRLLKQKREVDYVMIDTKKFELISNVSDEEVNDFYQKNQQQYEVPEQVKLAYLEVSRQKIAAGIEIDDAEIEKFYGDNKTKYSIAEERKVSHILIPVIGDDEAVKAQAKKDIDAIYARIIGGEDFAKVAKETSKDPGSAKNGGDLGFFKKGDMVAEFENKAFSLAKDALSEPFLSSFGYHIVKLNDIKPEQLKPLKDVFDEIKTSLQYEKAEKQFVEQSEQMQTLAYENPDSLQTTAAELGIEVLYSPVFSREGGSGIFSNAALIKATFSDTVFEEANNSDLIELSSDHAIVLRVEQKFAAKIKPLVEVKEKIKAFLVKKKTVNKAFDFASQLEKTFNEKQTLANELKKNGLELKQNGFVERDNREIPAAIIRKAFSLPRASAENKDMAIASAIKLANNQVALVIVRQVVDGGDKEDPQLAVQLSQMLLQSEAAILTNAAIQQVRNESEVEIFSERLKQD